MAEEQKMKTENNDAQREAAPPPEKPSLSDAVKSSFRWVTKGATGSGIEPGIVKKEEE